MKYYLIAGEASGDLHASYLMNALRGEDPDARFRFRGGDLMAREGGEKAADYRDEAVMGFSDVLGKLPSLLRSIRACKRDILEYKPDALILVDYPGFNLRIAKFAHRKGIRVIWYIAPKTWASRSGRNRALRKYVDTLFVIFPFELDYFKRHGVPYIYEGNPLVEEISHAPKDPVFEGPSIAILPGSRKGEIATMMPVCMKVADDLHALPQYSCYKFVIAGAPSRNEGDYAPWLKGREEYVSLVFGKTYGVVSGAQAAIVNSGTASLETAILGTPQLVGWASSPVTVWLARHVLKVGKHISFISLGNLTLGREVFREFIQEDFNEGSVLAELQRLIEDKAYRERMLEGYAQIRFALGGDGASARIARDIVSALKP